MKKLFANNNKAKYALVDDDIFETIQEMGLKFSIKNDGYWYSTTEIQLPGMMKKKCLLLHRFVFTLKTGEEPTSEIDHIDRNPGNNQFLNLRLATSQQQKQNHGKLKNNTSGYIGVSHQHNVNKRYKNGYRDYWRVSIQNTSGKREQKYFPYTSDGKIAAARWRDKKVREYFGEFAGQLNFPDEK